MIPYIILYIVLLICGFFEINRSTVQKPLTGMEKSSPKLYWVIIPVAIILFMGIFREITMGYDTETYYIYYWLPVDTYTWADLLTDFSIDNGFFLLLKIISLFTDDWWMARAILFVITFGLYYIAIYKNTPYPCISLIIFIGGSHLSLTFSILRQALAGAISMFAYRQIRKNCWVKCLLLILIASTIHKAALACVFMLIIYFLKFKKFSGYKLVLFSIISYVAFRVMIPLIISLYADSRYDGIAENNGGYGMLLFMIVVYVLMIFLTSQSHSNNDPEIGYMFNVSCGALFIQFGALQWDLLNRLGAFFTIYWCILFPKLICRFKQIKRILYYLIIALLFGFMFFYQLTEAEMFIMHKF